MGGCATKPKVAKDGEQPEPEPELQQVKEDIVGTKQEPLLQEEEGGVNPKIFDQIIDDQANKRRSLSLLFNKENEDEQVSTENEKSKAEETAKHETLEDKKPLEDAKSIEPTVKHESPKKEEKLYQESEINEPAEKQESAVVLNDVEEVITLPNQSTEPAIEIAKTEIAKAADKTSEETIIIEPAKETVEQYYENGDTKVSTENGKSKAEETVKQETLEDKKPLEDAKISEPTEKQESPKIEEKLSQETKSNEAATKQESLVDAKFSEPTVKHVSPKKEEKLSQETKINEPVTKQESAVVAIEEKPTLQNQLTDSAADVTVKTATPEEAKKTSQETKINEPVVEETAVKQNQNAIAAEVTLTKTETPEAVKVSEKTQSNELNEPIKQEKSSESNPIEDVVVSPPKKKVIEAVLPNAEPVENKAVETTSSIGEKNHVDAVVEHTPKASDVGSDKISLS